MPLQRRLPKHGFVAVTIVKAVEVRLGDLAKAGTDTIDLESLKKAGIIQGNAQRAKIILTGSIDKAVKVAGIPATKGAKAAIEKAGGSVAAIEVVAPVRKLVAKPAAK
jgi:large subunit ribosomal protein L15